MVMSERGMIKSISFSRTSAVLALSNRWNAKECGNKRNRNRAEE